MNRVIEFSELSSNGFSYKNVDNLVIRGLKNSEIIKLITVPPKNIENALDEIFYKNGILLNYDWAKIESIDKTQIFYLLREISFKDHDITLPRICECKEEVVFFESYSDLKINSIKSEEDLYYKFTDNGVEYVLRYPQIGSLNNAKTTLMNFFPDEILGTIDDDVLMMAMAITNFPIHETYNALKDSELMPSSMKITYNVISTILAFLSNGSKYGFPSTIVKECPKCRRHLSSNIIAIFANYIPAKKL